MKISIDIIADYGGNPGCYDMAFAEVKNKICSIFDAEAIDYRIMSCLSVNAFNTIETGFVVAQLASHSNIKNHVVYHNTAPRKDDISIRKDNAGENLAMSLLPNGVLIVGVYSGFTFSFIKNIAPIYGVKCDNKGSQFRSRDIFPQALLSLVKEVYIEGLSDLSKSNHATEIINNTCDIEINNILYIDGYGNLKTSLPESVLTQQKVVKIIINDIAHTAYISNDGIFGIENGNMVIAQGSSGGNMGNMKFLEISFRGGNAAERFNYPKPGDKIIIT